MLDVYAGLWCTGQVSSVCDDAVACSYHRPQLMLLSLLGVSGDGYNPLIRFIPFL